MAITDRTIHTRHADIAISETSGKGLPLLMIHGNSSSKEVFSKQLESELGDTFRLIAMDLPGHGASSKAFEPGVTYSWPGYAAAAIELLENMEISRAAVYGWSLGGQVGIEMLERFPGMAGLVLSGAPPVRATMESIQQGFLPTQTLMLTGQEHWTEEEFTVFGDTVFGVGQEPELREAARVTDPSFRRCLMESLIAGRASDQRAVVERSRTPIAIINGADDPIVNVGYIGEIQYGNLWDRHCFLLRGVGHLPFREAPEVFNALLGRFLNEIESRAAVWNGRKVSGAKTHAA